MGTIKSVLKLKIFCPKCEENLFGYSTFDDYCQEDHFTYCKNCGFKESFDETIIRIKTDCKEIETIKQISL
jgi:RNase P subunit RPR2